MPEVRTREDHDHPCLACGGPWLIVENGIEAGGQVVRWVAVRSNCARDCLRLGEVSVDRFNEALQERRQLGW